MEYLEVGPGWHQAHRKEVEGLLRNIYKGNDMKIQHHDNFTIRVIEKVGLKVEQEAIDAIVAAVQFTIERLSLSGHLFVTVVGAEAFRMSEDPEDLALGIYHEGVQHIALCGTVESYEPFGGTRENWMRELQNTAIHETIHYWQEQQGTLHQSEAIENEAEAMAKEFEEALRQIQLNKTSALNWRDATQADIGRLARFRNKPPQGDKWIYGILDKVEACSFDRELIWWYYPEGHIDTKTCSPWFAECQVQCVAANTNEA